VVVLARALMRMPRTQVHEYHIDKDISGCLSFQVSGLVCSPRNDDEFRTVNAAALLSSQYLTQPDPHPIGCTYTHTHTRARTRTSASRCKPSSMRYMLSSPGPGPSIALQWSAARSSIQARRGSSSCCSSRSS